MKTFDSPFWRANPVVGRGDTPAFERMPGHTVYSHLFTIVKVVDTAPVLTKKLYYVNETNSIAMKKYGLIEDEQFGNSFFNYVIVVT